VDWINLQLIISILLHCKHEEFGKHEVGQALDDALARLETLRIRESRKTRTDWIHADSYRGLEMKKN
jgi:hypothetical protein